MGDRTLFLGGCIWDGCICRADRQTVGGRHPVCADIRFLSQIDQTEHCWNWSGAVNTYGYGQLKGPPPKKRIILAHVYAWTRRGYLLPEGAVLRHSCDNRLCARPDHLELGTPQANVNDTWERGRARPRGQTLNAAKVRAIRHARNADGTSYQELADRFGVVYTTIARICTGRTWKEVVLWRGDLRRAWWFSEMSSTPSPRIAPKRATGRSAMKLIKVLRLI